MNIHMKIVAIDFGIFKKEVSGPWAHVQSTTC